MTWPPSTSPSIASFAIVLGHITSEPENRAAFLTGSRNAATSRYR